MGGAVLGDGPHVDLKFEARVGADAVVGVTDVMVCDQQRAVIGRAVSECRDGRRFDLAVMGR